MISQQLNELYELDILENLASIDDVWWNKHWNPTLQPKQGDGPEFASFFSDQEWKDLELLDESVRPSFPFVIEPSQIGIQKSLVVCMPLSFSKSTFQRIAKKANMIDELNELKVRDDGKFELWR